MSYPLTQSTGSIICGAGWVKRLIYYVKKFFGLIVLATKMGSEDEYLDKQVFNAS